MVRKTLLVASLALLAAGAGRPAGADPVFLEPYGEIYSARTFAASSTDGRPKDAVQGQGAGEEAKPSSFIISPFYRTTSLPGTFDDIGITMWGGSLGYASGLNGKHPWSLVGSVFNTNSEFGPDDDDSFSFDLTGKYILWQGADPDTLVVSLVGHYLDISDIGRRWDLLLAADHQIMKNAYVTVNAGYGNFDFDGGFGGGEFDDFRFGAGLTWMFSPRFSVSGNYVIKNEADQLSSNSFSGADQWSLSAAYAFNEKASVRVGGGKYETFFGNINYKF